MARTEGRTSQGADAVLARFPIAPPQRAFWFRERLEPGSAANTICVRWELRGPIRADLVEAAFRAVVTRHEILRTRFVEDDGAPVQEVLGDAPFRLAVLDLRNLPAEGQEARVAEIERELGSAGFDLSQPCPMRVALVQLAADRAAILIAVHHIVFDGYSIRVLGQEVGDWLASGGAEWSPPELELQYGDYALWRDACRANGADEADRAYWRGQLSDAPYVELPADRLAVSPAPHGPGRVLRPLGQGFEPRMDAAARRQGVSAFTLGAAAAMIALQRLTGAGDLVFGTPAAGRMQVELEPMIGNFVNTLVLRLPVDEAEPLAAVIARTGQVVAGALGHQGMAFDEVARLAPRRAQPARTPVFSILFGLQRVFLEERSLGPYDLVSVPSLAPGIGHDLDITILGRGSGWSLILDYDAGRFSRATAERHADAICMALEAVLGDGDARVGDLPDMRAAAVPAAVPVPVPVPSPPDPAGGEVEAGLRAIWCAVLGVEDAPAGRDFFELGGHSMLALRLLARVEAAFGLRPGVPDFLADPTLVGLVAAVARLQHERGGGAAVDGPWRMMQLRAGPAAGPVLVSVNQPFLYHNLARALRADLPVVNLMAAADTDPQGMGMDALVAAAADMVRAAHGGRPLVLLGNCVDGLLALELGRSLAQAGETVAMVGMIDSWAPDAEACETPAERRRSRRRARVRRWAHYLGRALRGEAGVGATLAKAGVTRRLLQRLGRIEPMTDDERAARDVNARLSEAARAHRFAGWDGEVMIFATERQSRDAVSGLLGWKGRLRDDTPVHCLPGWHEDALLDHGYRRLAEILDARMRRLS